MGRAQLTDLLYTELMEDAWEYLSGGMTGLEGSGWPYGIPDALVGKAQLGMFCQMPTGDFYTVSPS